MEDQPRQCPCCLHASARGLDEMETRWLLSPELKLVSLDASMTAPQVPTPLGSLCTTGGRREMKGAIRVGSRGSTSQSSSCEIWAQRWSGGVTRTSFAQCRSRLASCGATQRSAVLAAREPIFGSHRPQPRTLPSCQYSRNARSQEQGYELSDRTPCEDETPPCPEIEQDSMR